MSDNFTVTVKTGFSNNSVIPVEPVYKPYKSRNATESWKKNIYITKTDKLSEEEREAVATSEAKEEEFISNMSVNETYEKENSKPNKLKEELLSQYKAK